MTCHHQQFYDKYPDLERPWTKTWLQVAMPAPNGFVAKHGAGECWQCHQPEFCTTCHSTGKKPPPGTTFIRSTN
jgi:hypothetical protein